jgi:hypothetical protein
MSGTLNVMLSSLAGTGGEPIGYALTIPTLIQKSVVVSGANLYSLTAAEATGEGILLVKFTLSGDIVWQIAVNEAGAPTEASGMTVDSAGNIIVVGTKEASGVTGGYVVKIDSSGAILWQRRVAGNATGRATPLAVATDSSNNVYVTGISSLLSSSVLDMYVMKLDGATGNALFRKSNGATASPYSEGGNAIAVRDTLVAVAGYAYADASATLDAALFIVSTSTGTAPFRLVGDSTLVGRQEGVAVLIDSAGQIYMLLENYPTSSTSGQERGILVKRDPAAANVLTWAASYAVSSGTSDISPIDMCFDPTEAHIYAVYNYVGNVLIAKYSTSTGTRVWQRELGADVSTAVGIACDSSDNIYVSGRLVTSANTYIFKAPGDGNVGTGSVVVGAVTFSYAVATQGSSGPSMIISASGTRTSTDDTSTFQTPVATASNTAYVRTIANLVT